MFSSFLFILSPWREACKYSIGKDVEESKKEGENMRKAEERNLNSRLTEEDLREGKEFVENFSALNEIGKMLVNAYMAGLRGNEVVNEGEKKAG